MSFRIFRFGFFFTAVVLVVRRTQVAGAEQVIRLKNAMVACVRREVSEIRHSPLCKPSNFRNDVPLTCGREPATHSSSSTEQIWVPARAQSATTGAGIFRADILESVSLAEIDECSSRAKLPSMCGWPRKPG